MDTKDKPVREEKQIIDGVEYTARYYSNRVEIVDPSGVVRHHQDGFNQYGSEAIQSYIEKGGTNIRRSNMDYKAFGQQTANADGTYTSSKNNSFDWTDFKSRHGDWIEAEYKDKGGYAQFQKDITSGRATSEGATKWFQGAVNKKSMALTGKNYFDEKNTTGNPYGLDGKWGQVTASVPNFFDPIVPAEAKTPDSTTPEVVKDAVVKEDGDFTHAKKPDIEVRAPNDDWWIQDKANMAVGLTDQVTHYAPSLFQVPVTTADYTLLDPSRKIASQQEMYNENANVIANTSSGQTARANLNGMTGQAAAQISNDISQVENANVGIVNEVGVRNAALQSAGDNQNVQLRKSYQDEMATLSQQEDNSRRELKYRNLHNWMNGVSNKMKRNWLESETPQQSTDTGSGKIYYNGTAIDITPEGYASSGNFWDETRKSKLKELTDLGMSSTDAEKQATEYANRATTKKSEGYSGTSTQRRSR